MSQRVTAREIIETLVETMLAGAEPLVYTALVPSIYHVHLRTDDYERLSSIFPRVADEARQRLSEELTRLNEGSLWDRLKRQFGKGSTAYESAEGDWFISFHENADEDVEPGTFDIAVELALPPTLDLVGSPTKRIIFRRDGRGETKKVGESVAQRPAEAQQDARPPGAAEAGKLPVYARLEYEDDRGRQIYQMTKTQIIIGRGGIDYWVDVKLHTSEDVSREHVRLRQDPATSKFYIKDLSTLGTSFNGRRIPTSVELIDGEKRDINVEVELPPQARITLAGVVEIDFVAAEEP